MNGLTNVSLRNSTDRTIKLEYHYGGRQTFSWPESRHSTCRQEAARTGTLRLPLRWRPFPSGFAPRYRSTRAKKGYSLLSYSYNSTIFGSLFFAVRSGWAAGLSARLDPTLPLNSRSSSSSAFRRSIYRCNCRVSCSRGMRFKLDK